MPRIPRVGAFASLPSAVVPVNRVPFVARATFSTSTPVNALDSKTQWIRKQLWKGEAPGAEDPYTQRPEPEPTSLPNEALEASQGDRRPGAVRNTRLVLPPTHSEALTEKEIESVATDYIPATTIEDLEEIEPLKTWWEQPGHWGEESEFQGFGRAVKVQDQAVLEVYLRQALVESLSYQQRGLLEEYAAKKWPTGKRSHLDRTLAVSIRFENNGQPMLNTHFRVVTEELKARPEEERVEISPEEAKEMLNALDPSWKKASLGNDHLKFAIRKRLYQLTGHFIPDVKLAAANTPKELITVALTINKRGKKLAEVLEEQKGFSKLQNVTVHSRRVTPIDREVSVGRWKVIEEELRKRDLPVTGTGGYGKNKERDWLTGKA